MKTNGLALAIITPKWMTYLLNKDETVAGDFARFGLNVMGIQDQGNDQDNAKAGIEALQNFIKDELLLPTTLSEMNITDEKFDELKVKACYGQDTDKILEIINGSLKNHWIYVQENKNQPGFLTVHSKFDKKT